MTDVVHVETSTGTIEGADEGGVKVFKGIPYARPPLGELRLRTPHPLEPWTGVRSASRYGLWASQNPPDSTWWGEFPGEQGEDCLTLNVWTPELVGARPVLVWLHGGAFLRGSGASTLYHGFRLATQGDVVLVTINYRLGVLGFLAHPELADPDAGGAIGNWGLLDQVAALRRGLRQHCRFRWRFTERDDLRPIGRRHVGGGSAGRARSTGAVPGRAMVQSGPPRAMPAERAAEMAAKLLGELDVAAVADLRGCRSPPCSRRRRHCTLSARVLHSR